MRRPRITLSHVLLCALVSSAVLAKPAARPKPAQDDEAEEKRIAAQRRKNYEENQPAIAAAVFAAGARAAAGVGSTPWRRHQRAYCSSR